MNRSEAGKLGGIKSRVTQERQKQERIAQYNKNPKLCRLCQVALLYERQRNDFCSHRCAQSFNNVGVARNVGSGRFAEKPCEGCGKPTCNAKYCSNKCFRAKRWHEDKLLIETTGRLPHLDSGYGYSPRVAKRYLTETRGHQCEICHGEDWMGQPIPLVIDHISGDPEDHRLVNLRLVCGNCNMQLPTFAGRNKGKGRKSRGSFAYIPHK